MVQSARLGPFQLVDFLARGGMGSVWTARHLSTETLVAIKVMHRGGSTDPRQLAMFAKEVSAVAQIEHHRVVMVLDHGTVDSHAEMVSAGALFAGSPWLAMELCRGGSLTTRPPQDWAVAERILRDILAALAFSHARGVLHRDIKPDNVLFSAAEDARPGLKLSDFGLAHVFGNSEDSKVIMGTPHYMAPEQFRGMWRDFCPATDLYGVGCLAWRMLTGAAPFSEAQQHGFLAVANAHVSQRPGVFLPRFELPGGVEPWLRRLLQKAPVDRYDCAAAALAALPTPALLEDRTIDLTGLLDGLGDLDGDTDVLTSDLTGPRWPSMAFPAFPPPSLGRRGSLRLAGAGLGLFGLRGARFVGRTEVCTSLWSELRQVAERGRARAVHLRGPAGSGKSRVAWWLIHAARELGAATHLRVVHDEQAGAGHGLAAALRELLGLGGLEPKPLRKRLQSQFDKDTGVDVEVLTSWLSSGGGSADAPERFQAAAEVLRNRSAERPVVLFIDDAPWGFEAVRFVRFLFEQQTDRTLPVLVVFTSRDEALGERSEVAALLKELDEKNEMITHALKPLGREDAAALVDDLLGLTVDLRQQVVERSGGNPLFAVQLLSDWVARGALAVGPEGFVLRAGEAANIPPDIERLCARRLEDLLARHSAEERRALVLAATLGIEVDDEEWLATCEVTQLPSPTNLRSDLFRAGLAVPEEGGWRFVHGMIHESLLVGVLSAEEHRQAHAVCAKMLAVGSSGESANLEERIARHWGRAGQPERAVEAFERAFLRRRVTAELRSIAGSLPDWGDAVAQLPAATAGPAHGILHWGHSIIAHHRGQPGRAVSLAARAIELSGDAPRDIRVSMRLSMARSEEESGAIQASHATATAALALAGDDPLLGARCHLQIAWAAMRLGETEKAEAALELAGQMSELADDLVIRITVLRRLGVIAQRSKDHRRAIDLLSAALQQLRPKKIPMIETSLCNDIAECYRLQGDYAQAEVFYSRSAASANRSGYLVLKQMVTLNRLLMRLAEHEYRSVAAELRTMGEWIAQYGSHLHEAMWQAMSLLCAATGEAPEAAEVHLRALEQQLADQGLVEYDLADLLLRSVPHLRSGNAWKLADRALELAAHQFTCLGDKDDLARVEVLRPSAG